MNEYADEEADLLELRTVMSERDALSAEVERLKGLLAETDVSEFRALEGDNERLRAEVERLKALDPRILRCAFCDEEYPPGTPATQHEALTAHVMRCGKHPLRAKLAKAEKALEHYENCDDNCVAVVALAAIREEKP